MNELLPGEMDFLKRLADGKVSLCELHIYSLLLQCIDSIGNSGKEAGVGDEVPKIQMWCVLEMLILIDFGDLQVCSSGQSCGCMSKT
jgi:hypothetical protein